MRKEDVLEYLRRNPDALSDSDEFVVRRRQKTTKKTFEVEDAVLRRFMAEVDRRGLKIKDAVSEALSSWIKSR